MRALFISLVIVLTVAPAVALAQGLPIPLALSVNPNPVSAGQPISLAVSGTSPGFASPADIYVGAVFPSGAVQLFTPAGTQMVSVSDLANWTPLVTNLNVSTPATFTNVPVGMFTLLASDPPGSYVFFLAVVLSSFHGHSTLQPGDLLALGTAPLTVVAGMGQTFDGSWGGPTSDGSTISFTVQNNIVKVLGITFKNCVISVGSLNAAITNSAFSGSIFVDYGTTIYVSGTFSSGTSASGSATINNCGGRSVTWTATKTTPP
jgi:hypothetical protein